MESTRERNYAGSTARSSEHSSNGMQKFAATVKGFSRGTPKGAIEEAVKHILKENDVHIYDGIRCPGKGRRGHSAIIDFTEKDIFYDFMRRTRGDTFEYNVAEELDDAEWVGLTVSYYVSPQQYEDEKETCTLLRVIGKMGNIERSEKSWRTL